MKSIFEGCKISLISEKDNKIHQILHKLIIYIENVFRKSRFCLRPIALENHPYPHLDQNYRTRNA